MKTDFINQYEHTWRVFERLVRNFDPDGWLHTGRGPITPARLSFHILQAVQYYTEDKNTTFFASGKAFECDWASAPEADLPSQADLIECMGEFKAKTSRWLTDMDFECENKTFGWAGRTNIGLALFLLRHSLYHIGELSSLLNESRNGEVEDNYVKAL